MLAARPGVQITLNPQSSVFTPARLPETRLAPARERNERVGTGTGVQQGRRGASGGARGWGRRHGPGHQCQSCADNGGGDM